MKVLILSDIHLEFAPFEPAPDLEFDVVLLAGDIHSPACRRTARSSESNSSSDVAPPFFDFPTSNEPP